MRLRFRTSGCWSPSRGARHVGSGDPIFRAGVRPWSTRTPDLEVSPGKGVGAIGSRTPVSQATTSDGNRRGAMTRRDPSGDDMTYACRLANQRDTTEEMIFRALATKPSGKRGPGSVKFARASKYDGAAMTSAARLALAAKWERQADPDGTLPEAERNRRAIALRRSHMARMSLASAKARREKKRAEKVVVQP